MKSDQYIHFRDILIIIGGILGAAWYFFDYGNHNVMDTAEINFDQSEIEARTDSLLEELDYENGDYDRLLNFSSYNSLIDTLQKTEGRTDLVSDLRTDSITNPPLFYWDLRYGWSTFDEPLDDLEDEFIRLQYAENGELLEFEASVAVVRKQKPYNRSIIRNGMLQGRADKAAEDSLIKTLLGYQHIENYDLPALEGGNLPSLVDLYKQQVGEVSEEMLTGMVWNLGDYYLANSYWKNFDLQQDSLGFSDGNGLRVATAYYSIEDAGNGIPVVLTLDVLPAGSLKKMDADMPGAYDSDSEDVVRGAVILVVLFAFAVWILVVFYLRIKAKVIDTQSSLVIALIAGFLLPLGILLQDITSLQTAFLVTGVNELVRRVIQFGFLGAATSIIFFVLTAVSDSITRQYMPEKLESFDLIRNGHINNKPIGWVAVRGVSLGLFALGLFSASLWLIPDATLSNPFTITANFNLFKPVMIVVLGLLLGFFLTLVVFQLVGNQLYAFTQNQWVIPIASALIFGLIQPFGNLFDFTQGGLISAILGFYFGYIYLRTDFLTTAVTFVTFSILNSMEQTWLIDGTHEIIVFYTIISFFVILFTGGAVAIARGHDVNVLPSYIPEYMEEMAKEQRIRQELHIARQVQFSFLPTYIPKMNHYDLAGYCDPAQETGGDYFDMVKLDDERVAIAIGDVSGKGIQAAFYMTFAKGVIHSLCSILSNPMELLSKANQLFNDNATRGTFISMIYGILDQKNRTFRFVRAGHNPILLKKKSGETEWLQPKGVAIGMMKGEGFDRAAEEMNVHLDGEVDCLVLYTDGITEAANRKNEFYGEHRLKRLVENASFDSSQELIDLIIKDVNRFKGAAEQHDDITCVVIKAKS